MNSKQKLISLIENLDQNKVEEIISLLTPEKTKEEEMTPGKTKEEEMNDFLLSILKETTAKITGEKEITHFNFNGEWLIQQDYINNNLYISQERIWSIFETKFNLSFIQTKTFINSWIQTNIGWNNLNPIVAPYIPISKFPYKLY